MKEPKLTQTKAKELFNIVNRIKQLQGKESKLKNDFKSCLGDGSFAFGPYIVTISDVNRTTLDRDEIEKILGDRVKKYERIINFQKLEIKKIG